MGGHPSSPIDNGGRCGDELNGRDLKGLAEGDRCQLHRPHIFLLVHDGSRFSREVDAGLFPQAKLGEILAVSIHPQALPHVDEYRVAGVHGSLEEIFPSMSSCLMAADPPVLHNAVSRTVKCVGELHRPGLKAGCRSDNLEG